MRCKRVARLAAILPRTPGKSFFLATGIITPLSMPIIVTVSAESSLSTAKNNLGAEHWLPIRQMGLAPSQNLTVVARLSLIVVVIPWHPRPGVAIVADKGTAIAVCRSIRVRAVEQMGVEKEHVPRTQRHRDRRRIVRDDFGQAIHAVGEMADVRDDRQISERVYGVNVAASNFLRWVDRFMVRSRHDPKAAFSSSASSSAIHAPITVSGWVLI